jgi:hypothetical protein
MKTVVPWRQTGKLRCDSQAPFGVGQADRADLLADAISVDGVAATSFVIRAKIQ